jgi:hypothetical protein
MRMIPASPYDNQSRAELLVFDRLKAAFNKSPQLRLTAFHSLNLTRHASKRFGEIDFLIVGQPGIFVLEVKGGSIKCESGVWYSTDHSGVTHRLRESPFRQAQSALHGLMEKVRESQPDSLWSKFTIGYGVILPGLDFDVQGSEWDKAMVADGRAGRNLERWLSGLFAYWKGKDLNDKRPTDEDIAALQRFFRPGFETAIPLHVQIEALEGRAAELTKDQMRLVDIAEVNERVICAGGAGTGKTFLALELARRWAGAGLKVLVACRSPWLRHWLETRFAIPGVAVALADSAGRAARRFSIQQFDALVVDEGQDLLQLETLDRLDAVLAGGLNRGRWCFFHDANNQSGLLAPADPDALALLRSYGPVAVPLRTNCRNTRQILDRVQSALGADMGVEGTGSGPEVRTRQATSQEGAAQALAEEIDYLVNQGGLHPGGITILSPLPFQDSLAAQLPRRLASKIQVLDEYAMRGFPPAAINFAEIANFKGLENEAVIVVDLPTDDSTPESIAAAYVAMSRPRAVLTLIQQAA